MSRLPDARPSGPPPLRPVAGALSDLLDSVRPLVPTEAGLAEAIGAVLAEPLLASNPVPDRALALRRGWAVAWAEVVGASPYAPMFLSRAPAFVEAGDPLPPGADAVLPPDAVIVEAGIAQAVAETAPGSFVRRPGEDAGAGALLRAAGEIVHTRHAALARAAGVRTCRIRRPRLVILHDGSADAEAAADLAAALARGADASALTASLGRDAEADALLVLGAPDAAGLADVPALALRPGEAARCGPQGGLPVVVAPARLADALAAALVLLRPVLDRLSGATGERPCRLPLTRKIASSIGFVEVALLRETAAGFEPLGTADLTLLALAQADAWLAVPPESEGFAAGETVSAFPL